jgi:hypothetical protein
VYPTKKDLQSSIWTYCEKTCTVGGKPVDCPISNCPLWPYRCRVADIQTNIFRTSDKELFFSKVLESASSFGPEPFFWSELRERVNLRPLHDNWWGVATRVLKSKGFGIIEGARRSKYKSRCGALDRRWKRYSRPAP